MTIPRGNLLGASMFVVTSIPVLISKFVFKLPDPIVMIIAGIALIVLDFAFRYQARHTQGWQYKQDLGGYLFFLPIWGLGIVAIIANVIQIFSK